MEGNSPEVKSSDCLSYNWRPFHEGIRVFYVTAYFVGFTYISSSTQDISRTKFTKFEDGVLTPKQEKSPYRYMSESPFFLKYITYLLKTCLLTKMLSNQKFIINVSNFFHKCLQHKPMIFRCTTDKNPKDWDWMDMLAMELVTYLRTYIYRDFFYFRMRNLPFKYFWNTNVFFPVFFCPHVSDVYIHSYLLRMGVELRRSLHWFCNYSDMWWRLNRIP